MQLLSGLKGPLVVKQLAIEVFLQAGSRYEGGSGEWEVGSGKGELGKSS